MRHKLLAVSVAMVLALGTIANRAKADETPQLPAGSQEAFEEALAEQQEYRESVWESYVIEWPSEKYVIDPEVDGEPGVDYDDASVVLCLKPTATPSVAISQLQQLTTASLTQDEASLIDADSIEHQYPVSVVVNSGYTVQDVIDELWNCSTVDYACPNAFLYEDDAVRGDPSVTKGDFTYTDPVEGAEMEEKYRRGEITEDELRVYRLNHCRWVYPGVKRVIEDWLEPGVNYAEDEILVVPQYDTTVSEMTSVIDSLGTSYLTDGERALITPELIEKGDGISLKVRDGYTVQDAIDEAWEYSCFAYVCENGYAYEEGSEEPSAEDPSPEEIAKRTNANPLEDDTEVDLPDPDEPEPDPDPDPEVDPDDGPSGSSLYAQHTTIDDSFSNNQVWLNLVDAKNAWDISRGQGRVSIAVIDTGFDTSHSDFAGIYDMQNAYNSVDGSSNVSPLNDHGTHVAGIIAARTNNSYGVAGISYNARIVPVRAAKVFPDNKVRFDYRDVAHAITYLCDKAADGTIPNLSVINMSLGDFRQQLYVEKYLQRAYDMNIAIVCSAGNYGSNTDYDEYYDTSINEFAYHYYSDSQYCISVTAVDNQKSHAAFSQFNQYKDIAAPGVAVYSTLPESQFGNKNGTSMAAPVVSGIVGLLYAYKPTMTVADVKDILYSTATDLTGSFTAPVGGATITYGAGWDKVTGHGLVNAAAALEEALDRDGSTAWDRAYGTTRYDTCAAVSSTAFSTASTVIIVSGVSYQDALTASALAGAENAPILMVPKTGLPSAIGAEIERLGATKAIIVGGESAIPTVVRNQIAAKVGTVETVAGTTSIDTCLALSNKLGNRRSNTAIIASGASFADALSISSYAYASKSQIFLTNSSGTLTTAEVNAINSAGYKKVLLVGGTLAVKESVKTQLASSGRVFYRLAGTTKYDTTGVVARWATGLISNPAISPVVTLQPSKLYLATGTSSADALGAASAAGKNRGVLLLVEDTDTGRNPINAYVVPKASSIDRGYIVGGTLAIPSSIARDYMVAAA